jgi:hypothetical protein
MFVGKDPCESLTLAFEEHIFRVCILCIESKENNL